MHNDAMHLPITTGSALLIYKWTLQELVLILWAVYVVILIITKLPDFYREVVRMLVCMRGHWSRFKEWKRGSKN